MRGLAVAALILSLSTSVAATDAGATELAVTVDDLPTHGPLPAGTTRLAIATRMIQALTRHAVPEVYGFTNGGQLAPAPELEEILRAWRGAGFLLANHTFSHLDLTRVSAAQYLADVERNETFLARLARPGAPPKYFRHPYLHDGDTAKKRAAVLTWLRRHGYTVAPVTVYFQDWLWNDVYARCVAQDDQGGIARLKRLFLDAARSQLAASEELSLRLLGRPIRHVLLLHIGAFDAIMLDELLAVYRAAGARFVGLSEAVQDPVYGMDPGPVTIGEASFLVRIARTRQIAVPAGLDPADELARLCRGRRGPIEKN